MIASLKGTVNYIDDKYAVIEVCGVGYKVFLTKDTLRGLKNDREVSLSTHMAIREDAMDIYGFNSKKEKDCFELLISVSSIGPKSAMNILNLIDVDGLKRAIKTGSTSHLVKVSGIGRKTAEKIVLELKDKLGIIGSDDSDETANRMSSDMDAMEALKALGYEADDAREALKNISHEISDTGAKVKAALKNLG